MNIFNINDKFNDHLKSTVHYIFHTTKNIGYEKVLNEYTKLISANFHDPLCDRLYFKQRQDELHLYRMLVDINPTFSFLVDLWVTKFGVDRSSLLKEIDIAHYETCKKKKQEKEKYIAQIQEDRVSLFREISFIRGKLERLTEQYEAAAGTRAQSYNEWAGTSNF